MRNVTLSIDETLLEESRAYARERGTTLNQLVRDLLKKTVTRQPGARVQEMLMLAHDLDLRSDSGPLRREDIYERG